MRKSKKQIELEERWERSVSNHAGDVLAARAYWKLEFGGGWERFPCPNYLARLARDAAREWEQLAQEFEARK